MSVSATFKTNSAAEETLRQLEAEGFSDADLSVVMTDHTRGNSFNIDEHTKAAEGVAYGGFAGGLIGAIAVGLTSVGAIATGGPGLLVSGPLIAALAGGGAGAATGGLLGGLIGLGIPEHEAKVHHNLVKDGAVLIAVTTDDKDKRKRARTIFEQQDAHHIAA